MSKKQKKKKKQQKLLAQLDDDDDDDDDDDKEEKEVKKVEEEKKVEEASVLAQDFEEKVIVNDKDVIIDPCPEEQKNLITTSEDLGEESTSKKSVGKTLQNLENVSEEETTVENDVTLHVCNICGKDYPTRNKLFDHLKSTGHQSRFTKSPATTVQGKSSKKNKKKEKR